MSLTDKKVKKFINNLLAQSGRKISFMDVGSGGELKYPWTLLDTSNLELLAIEPTGSHNEKPLCVSNKVVDDAIFNVAIDERASSLHKPSQDFMDRFKRWKTMEVKEAIPVRLTTIDELAKEKMTTVDLMDVNVEGHDYQVLEGGTDFLTDNWVKVLKVEFEIADAWEDQKYFSDIDGFLNQLGYVMEDIELNRRKPTVVEHLHFNGELLWGKALYTKKLEFIQNHLMENDDSERELLVGIVSMVLFGFVGRANDLIELASKKSNRLNGIELSIIKKQMEEAFHLNAFERMLLNFTQKVMIKLDQKGLISPEVLDELSHM